MARIYAGTAFNQVISVDSHDKRKQKTVFGAINREAIIQVAHSRYLDTTFYASAKAVTAVNQGDSSELVRMYGKEKIIFLDVGCKGTGLVTYVLSNGEIHQSSPSKNENN